MAGNNNLPEMEDQEHPVTWSALRESLLDARESNMSLEHSQSNIPGISKASEMDADNMRKAVACVQWLSVVCAAAHKAQANQSKHKQANLDARQCMSMLLKVPESERPFRVLEPKTTLADMNAKLSSTDDYDASTCTVEWGPPPGDVRDLLSPAAMGMITWLGPRYSIPLLDLAFAFASNYDEFSQMWLGCPASTADLDIMGVEDRAATIRALPEIKSPGDAIILLTRRVEETLSPMVEAIFKAYTSRNFVMAAVQRRASIVHVSEFIKAAATQYNDCAVPTISKVQSVLPDSPSCPAVTPNFEDDKSTTWFKAAEYAFDNIRMPVSHMKRGDPSAEFRWHQYQCDIQQARMACMRLSERQVMQHLLHKASKSADHYVVATTTMLRPNATVPMFLETIREYYFTSGQFRYNVERSWQEYDACSAITFNDLIQYIKMYYQLIFIDYASLPGKQTKHDYACIAFRKIQQLLVPSSKSPLHRSLFDFLPKSTLVDRFLSELSPALLETRERADKTADNFLTWLITTLLTVRESANTIQRFAETQPEAKLDYARGHTRPNRFSHNENPKLQNAANQMERPPSQGDLQNDLRRQSG